ncbi:MAG: diguanylate cyclase domain-containing protein [Candidatus Wenzhouxiangella sp. M2_3B_020]
MRSSNFRIPLPAVALLLVIAIPAPADDWGARLEALEKLAYGASEQSLRSGIAALEEDIAQATPRQRARFTILKARTAAVTNRTERAIALLRPIIEGETAADGDIELRALTLSANILVVDGQFERGFDQFRRAVETAPVVDSADVRAHVYNMAADLHARIGEYSTAIEYADRAMAQLERPDGLRHHCIALERRGRSHAGIERLEAAERDYRRSAELCERVPDLLFRGLSLVGLADVLRRDDRTGEAEAILAEGLDTLSEAGFREGELQARTMMAEILLELDRPAQARQVMEPTWPLIRQPGNLAARTDALRVHASLAERAGSAAEAFEHRRRAMTLQQREARRMRAMRLNMVMSDLDDEARERELDLLRSRNNLNVLDRANRRQEELAITYAGSGAVVAGVLVFALLIKTARDRRMFRKLSQRDGLTGLLNHTRFFELSEQAFQRARQTASPFSLIVADIDLFKRVNDEYGHLVGDAVLSRIGARFRSAFGEDAIIGRLGGEEFGVALPDCDMETAVARIEHLRAILNRQRIDDQEPDVTMSFGVAELARESTLDVLYAHADQALYDAKDSGRNRVITVARLDLGANFVT